VQAFGLFYAHELVTVWMIPEKKDALSKQFDYTGGWAAAEHRLATLLKSTSDLSGYSGPWPQLLDLSEDIDSEHNERIHRPSPSEPLAFRTRHEFGTAAYVEGEDEREVVTHMYRDALVEMFTCAQALTFNRLGWLDTDASRLALLLPLGSQVQELHLSFNSIGDQGLFLLAQRMTQMVQLKVLNLAGNQIGDPGASRLSGALTEATALQSSLFNLDLGQNNIGDKGALALAASVGGDTKMALRKLNLKGNPLSPAAKKGVTKALKKQAKGGAPAATGR
jgi:Ran GTPase-activating protein (RanGAP) involved in mRNA processing and transport